MLGFVDISRDEYRSIIHERGYPNRDDSPDVSDRPVVVVVVRYLIRDDVFGGMTRDDSPYRCAACGREFPTEADLEDHIKTVGLVY